MNKKVSTDGWGAHSVVVAKDGNLLTVYRGQHGAAEHWAESKLGSLSFGTQRAASIYAMSPNNRNDKALSPKVFPVYLDIRNPFVNAQDPFLDLSRYAEVFGLEETKRIALKFEDHVMNTNVWLELSEDIKHPTVEKLMTEYPDRLLELYFNIYPLLDDVEEVARLRTAGFDGAIYDGSGETATETEYRAFSENQVRSVWHPCFMS
ncbi:TPA: hypothetical protein QDB04_000195 [Burkholderia vietnamiensis]|nr:hypothetical protein [Burkholderia vietnamiensis]